MSSVAVYWGSPIVAVMFLYVHVMYTCIIPWPQYMQSCS